MAVDLRLKTQTRGISSHGLITKVVLHDKNSGDSIEFLENIVFQ